MPVTVLVAGAGGHWDHAHLAGGAGVTVGHVRGALLVAGQHVVDLLAVVEGVVDLMAWPPG